jgi:hypothetical protein
MRAILAVSILGLTAGTLPAQLANFLGFTGGFDVSYIDRAAPAATNATGDCLQHFSSRHYKHWLLDPADPLGATADIIGFRLVIQDQVGTTPDQYTLVGYKADVANPGFPDANVTGSGIWFRTGLLTTPPNAATGPIVFTITFGINPPSTPLTHVHPNDDFWFGIGLGISTGGNWPTDGIAPHMAFNFNAGNAGTNSLDVVGPRITDTTTNLSCFVQTNGGAGALPLGPAVYPTNTLGGYRQLRLEILAMCTGGVSVTQTNQLRYPSSLPAAVPNPAAVVPFGGTTNMLSGLHPDVNDDTGLLPPPPGSPPRADDVGFLVTERNRPNSVVIVRMAFGPAVGGFNADGSVPILFVPGFGAAGTRGNLCIDLFGQAFTFFGVSGSTGVFQQMMGLTPQARLVIDQYQPIDFLWQGFVTNLAVNPIEVKATGCVTHHL